MTDSEAIKELQQNIDLPFGCNISKETTKMAIQALENQIKIKEIIANANQWSKDDAIVKAQGFSDIERILN